MTVDVKRRTLSHTGSTTNRSDRRKSVEVVGEVVSTHLSQGYFHCAVANGVTVYVAIKLVRDWVTDPRPGDRVRLLVCKDGSGRLRALRCDFVSHRREHSVAVEETLLPAIIVRYCPRAGKGRVALCDENTEALLDEETLDECHMPSDQEFHDFDVWVILTKVDEQVYPKHKVIQIHVRS